MALLLCCHNCAVQNSFFNVFHVLGKTKLNCLKVKNFILANIFVHVFIVVRELRNGLGYLIKHSCMYSSLLITVCRQFGAYLDNMVQLIFYCSIGVSIIVKLFILGCLFSFNSTFHFPCGVCHHMVYDSTQNK